jgi:hypothetical protein
VIVTSAVTGLGVAELAAAIAAGPRGRLLAKEPGLFERWVLDEHGAAGLRRLRTLAPTTAAYLAACGGLEACAARLRRRRPLTGRAARRYQRG